MKLRIAYLIVLILASLYVGWALHDYTTKPQIITQTVEVPIERIVRVEIPVEVVKEVLVYIDKPVIEYQQAPIPQKEWQNLDEFLGMMPSITYFKANSCLWAAENLQKILNEQGYPVSIAVTWNGYYYGQRVNDTTYGHAGLLVGIQGSYYFYDPETRQMTRLF